MTKQELIGYYSLLGDDPKVLFLAGASHSLTLAMRGLYDSKGKPDERIIQLQGANELQHHLSSQLRHHHELELKRYPDDVFVSILFEKADMYRISNELAWSMRFAIKALPTP